MATDRAGGKRQMVARNKRAFHDYAITDTYEAGLVLSGTEVKSLRAGRASLMDGYAVVRDGEAWLHNVHIPEYAQGNVHNHEPTRDRKLLAKKREIAKWAKAVREKGTTLVPLEILWDGSLVKVRVALVRGKKLHDNRDTVKKREQDRSARQARDH